MYVFIELFGNKVAHGTKCNAGEHHQPENKDTPAECEEHQHEGEMYFVSLDGILQLQIRVFVKGNGSYYITLG